MIKVKALDTYEKLNIKDEKLNIIPKKGKIFEVTEERLKVLLGENRHHIAFVEIVEDKKEEK